MSSREKHRDYQKNHICVEEKKEKIRRNIIFITVYEFSGMFVSSVLRNKLIGTLTMAEKIIKPRTNIILDCKQM